MNALTNEQIQRTAPSVFATEPWEKVSARYAFIPTIDVVEALRNEGFLPVMATQSKTRIPGKQDFTKHLLRFRREQDMMPRVVDGNAHHFYAKQQQPELPEIVLVNSHDRSSSYQLSAGIFRLVCSNGMVVRSASFGDIRVYHSGDIQREVIEGSYQIIEQMPKVLEQMNAMKQISLMPHMQTAYAAAALELRYPFDEEKQVSLAPVNPGDLLRVRRIEDAGNDLWSTFNRVQENFIKGGLRGYASTGRRMKTRAIKSVNEDLRLNKALWLLTEKMAMLSVANSQLVAA